MDPAAAYIRVLDSCVSSARSGSPALQMFTAKNEGVAASVQSVRTLDPPQVAVEAMASPAMGVMETQISLQQMIPFPGKIASMAAAESTRETMNNADRQAVEQDLVLAIRMLVAEIWLVDRKRLLNNESLRIVSDLLDLARNQYAAGIGKQADLIRATTERATLANDSIILVNLRASLVSSLNARCAAPLNRPLDPLPPLDPVVISFNADSLIQRLDAQLPEISSMRANIKMLTFEKQRAAKENLPDIMVKGTYVWTPDESLGYGGMVGLTLPFVPWSAGKNAGAKNRATAGIRETELQIDKMKQRAAEEVSSALYAIQSAQQRMALARDVSIPQAEHTMESARAAYSSGSEGFSMLLDAQKMSVMARLDYHMAVMNLLLAEAELNRAFGADVGIYPASITGKKE